MTDLQDLQQTFLILNSKCNYLVLRNFEEYYDDILLPGHNDIDVLVASKKDARIMIKVFEAIPRFQPEDGIHYKFLYRGVMVDLDIRIVGDGYYDKKWEKDLIANRRLDNRGFYIIGDITEYFYSLVYHAILQKDYLADDYIIRFKNMGVLDVSECVEEKLLVHLHRYMIQSGYYYSVPLDISCMHRYFGALVKERYRYPLLFRYKHMKDEYGSIANYLAKRLYKK